MAKKAKKYKLPKDLVIESVMVHELDDTMITIHRKKGTVVAVVPIFVSATTGAVTHYTIYWSKKP